ncbi:MAG: S4 domain-containing protein [Pacificimonas sp.]
MNADDHKQPDCGAGSQRIDKFLWFARLTKTRSEARRLAESRHLRIDGRVITRASVCIRPGSIIAYARADAVHVVRVEALAARRGPFEQARHLYCNLTQD